MSSFGLRLSKLELVGALLFVLVGSCPLRAFLRSIPDLLVRAVGVVWLAFGPCCKTHACNVFTTSPDMALLRSAHNLRFSPSSIHDSTTERG